jgi:anti-anti-sigma factor
MGRRPGFDIEVRPAGSTVTVVPRGELDLATAGRLREVLQAQEAPNHVIELDLGELEFIDASGLAVVLEEHQRAQRDGFNLHVVVGTGMARRLIDFIGAPWERE